MVDDTLSRRRYSYLVLWLIVVGSAAIVIGMLFAPLHQARIPSIYKLGYLVGSTTQSLVVHRGLLVCTDLMGTPNNPICFRSARMPVASSVLAGLVKLVGDRVREVAVGKAMICLLPLWAAIAIVLRSAQARRVNVLRCAALLFLPFLIVNYLVVVTSMEVEEGYFFGLIPLVLVIILYQDRLNRWGVLGTAVALALVYLSKSSMLPVVFVLLVAFCLRLTTWKLRLLAVCIVALAPASWAVYQHHVSGRYTLGTSLDGINLHKGNNPDFQARYPSANSYLDSFDSQLNAGQFFNNEWTFNDYHLATARQFALSHPGYTLVSEERKIVMMLFAVDSYNKTKISRGATVFTEAGLLCFRILLWISLLLAAGAAFGVHRIRIDRFSGWTYLLFVAAYCFPYLLGFGFIRHAVVLVYPAVVFCCLAIVNAAHETRSAAGPEAGQA